VCHQCPRPLNRGQIAELLEPLYQRLKRFVLDSKVVGTDDTPVKVIDRTLPHTRKGRFWPYVGDRGHPAVVYDYTPTRERAGPERFLKPYRGYLQADAYAGYDALYATGRMTEVGCMAHARRYFWDAKGADEARALLALGFIQQLYRVEAEAKTVDAATRRALREAHARPVLERFRLWLDEQADVVLPKSPIGEAVHYARAQWGALTRYLEDGDLAIDNNASERALRRVCMGRNKDPCKNKVIKTSHAVRRCSSSRDERHGSSGEAPRIARRSPSPPYGTGGDPTPLSR